MQRELHIDCESRIERARSYLKEELKASEYGRLASQLDLIERDRSIRNEFKRLKKQGITGSDAILLLADRFYLSPDRVDEIVYQRAREVERLEAADGKRQMADGKRES